MVPAIRRKGVREPVSWLRTYERAPSLKTAAKVRFLTDSDYCIHDNWRGFGRRDKNQLTTRNAPHMRRICAELPYHSISLNITPFHSISFHYRKPLSLLRRILYIKPSILFFFGSFFLLRQKEPSRVVYKHRVSHYGWEEFCVFFAHILRFSLLS